MTREYSSISVETTLQSTINSSTTSITVATGTATALMGGVTLDAGNVDQFTVALDPDTINEEIVFVTNVTGDTLTVVRAQAGSLGVSHTAGATVRHVLTSSDLIFYTTGVATANAAIPKTLTTTTGDIIYASSANTPARLAIGSTGQALVVASGIPSWGTVATTPRIGQVVTATTTSSTASTGGAGYVDVSGLSVTITPTLSTSKILIVTSFALTGAGTTYQSGLVQLLRGATSLTAPVIGGYYPSGGGVNTAVYYPYSLQYIDSPATTSATTYKMQINNVFSANTWSANSSAVSVQISAMEILV